MTRLFLRFYLGVICILLMAFLIQGFIFRQRNESKNLQVVEQALSGGVRLAIERLDLPSEDAMGKTLASIQSEFEYPVQLLSLAELQLRGTIEQRLSDGQVVFYYRGGQGFVASALSDREHMLEFGPLPSFVGPSQTEVTLGFGVVLLLAALAIAILLRPVAGQLRAVEKTATAIADGDLSARIEKHQVSNGLPLANAFNTMADRTQRLLNSQRELLQAVSHELRTPLARIRFATDLIESAASERDRSERLAAVDRATQELDELVGELLTYVRLESPDEARQAEEFGMHELAHEVIESCRTLYPATRFSVNVDPNVEQLTIHGDRLSISRAIGNLVGNAGKLARTEVAVSLRRDGGTCVIDVDDDGPGVPESDRKRIFEPFVRLPNSPGRGAGLGLALVARIVERQRGSITVSKSPLGGARFEFCLPL